MYYNDSIRATIQGFGRLRSIIMSIVGSPGLCMVQRALHGGTFFQRLKTLSQDKLYNSKRAELQRSVQNMYGDCQMAVISPLCRHIGVLVASPMVRLLIDLKFHRTSQLRSLINPHG